MHSFLLFKNISVKKKDFMFSIDSFQKIATHTHFTIPILLPHSTLVISFTKTSF